VAGRRRLRRQIGLFAAAALLLLGIVVALGPPEPAGIVTRTIVVADLPTGAGRIPAAVEVIGELSPLPLPPEPPPPELAPPEPPPPSLARIAAAPPPPLPGLPGPASGPRAPRVEAATAAAEAPAEPPPVEVELAVIEPPAPRLAAVPDPGFRPEPVPAAPATIPAPPAARRGTGLIALIIDDIGPARTLSARAIALPAPLTMAILPYSEGAADLARAARKAGHEVFLHMPMQPLGDENPGRNALRMGMDAAALRERLDWAIDRVDGAVGMNNHMGSRLTAEPAPMAVVMEVLRRRGLMFVDSRTTQHSVAAAAAAEAGLPHTSRDVFLDHFPGAAFVRRQLAELEAKARAHGVAVAIGHPQPATLELLERWIPDAKARGFRFVPASAAIAARGCDGQSPAGRCGLLHTVNNTAAVPGG
jgi:hypothetical protein